MINKFNSPANPLDNSGDMPHNQSFLGWERASPGDMIREEMDRIEREIFGPIIDNDFFSWYTKQENLVFTVESEVVKAVIDQTFTQAYPNTSLEQYLSTFTAVPVHVYSSTCPQ